MDQIRVHEPNLAFGRVDIHIHAVRLDVQEQNKNRVNAFGQERAITIRHSVTHRRIANWSPVDEEILRSLRPTRMDRINCEAAQADPRTLAADFDRTIEKPGT